MASGGRNPAPNFHLGDTALTMAGRRVVLTSKLGKDAWLAQYLEAALKGSYDYIVMDDEEIERDAYQG